MVIPACLNRAPSSILNIIVGSTQQIVISSIKSGASTIKQVRTECVDHFVVKGTRNGNGISWQRDMESEKLGGGVGDKN